MGFHDDARLCSIDAGAPAALRSDGIRVAGLELLGVLAKVTDVALPILGKIVKSVFDLLAVDGLGVVNNDTTHIVYDGSIVGNGEGIRASFSFVLIDKSRSRPEGH